ncbi:MAG: DNRLRE domain-containing protein [Planctomycetota bacterium]
MHALSSPVKLTVVLVAALSLMLGLSVVTAAEAPSAEKADAPQRPKPHKTDWLYNARWGVMYHYVSRWHPRRLGTEELWEKAIKNFDAEGLAKQLSELGAGYFMITARHVGHPVAPNSLVKDGRIPSRDLIIDLAKELEKYDIKMMLYFACGGPEGTPDAAKIITELSERYGVKIKGWWIDNNPIDRKLQKMLADACRAGNPDALVAFSPPKGQQRNSPYEDFTAGNTHAPRKIRCDARFIQGLQWHTLTYLGYNWGGACKEGGAPRFTPEWDADVTVGNVAGGGVITWDTPYEINGLIHPDCIDRLKVIGKAAREAKRETPESKGLPRRPKPHKTDWLYNARWGIFYEFVSAGGPSQQAAEANWGQTVGNFNVAGLVKTLKDVDAHYFMIPARYSRGLPLAPGRDYKDGKFPTRDVIAELADALAAEKIKLMLYFACGEPAKSAAVVEELSRRYGGKVSAWWFDNTPGDQNAQKLLADAARAGNGDALLAFAGGIPYHRNSPYQDFTGGRTNKPGLSICEKRFVGGLQWHTLGTLGFSKYQKRYDAARAAQITARHLQRGGVITWNTAFQPDGQIAPEWFDVVKAIGKAAREAERIEQEPGIDAPVAEIPTPPDDAVTTTLTHIGARCISAKQDWFPERQRGMALVTGVGQRHSQFVRAQLQFDLSEIDREKPLHSAVLYLYCNAGPIGDPVCQRNQMIVNRFLRQLAEREQRWYNVRVASEGEQLVYLTKEGMYAINVTEIVKAWLSGEPNYGFRLSAPGLGANWQRYTITWKNFESKPYHPQENPKGPRLVIHQLPE